jgi:hypothetical protein
MNFIFYFLKHNARTESLTHETNGWNTFLGFLKPVYLCLCVTLRDSLSSSVRGRLFLWEESIDNRRLLVKDEIEF